jgi:hypothetical protein
LSTIKVTRTEAGNGMAREAENSQQLRMRDLIVMQYVKFIYFLTLKKVCIAAFCCNHFIIVSEISAGAFLSVVFE